MLVQSKIAPNLTPLLENRIYQNITSSMGGGDCLFLIADVGCATGMNTLLTVDTIIRDVKLTFVRHPMDMPKFQVYHVISFNDNDQDLIIKFRFNNQI